MVLGCSNSKRAAAGSRRGRGARGACRRGLVAESHPSSPEHSSLCWRSTGPLSWEARQSGCRVLGGSARHSRRCPGRDGVAGLSLFGGKATTTSGPSPVGPPASRRRARPHRPRPGAPTYGTSPRRGRAGALSATDVPCSRCRRTASSRNSGVYFDGRPILTPLLAAAANHQGGLAPVLWTRLSGILVPLTLEGESHAEEIPA